MSAELVDPFTTPPRRVQYRASTIDLRADITARIAVSSQNDPPLCPELVQKAITELARAADGEPRDALAIWAQWLLQELHNRAVDGIPYGEPQEPADSLDSYREPPLIRRVETVVRDL